MFPLEPLELRIRKAPCRSSAQAQCLSGASCPYPITVADCPIRCLFFADKRSINCSLAMSVAELTTFVELKDTSLLALNYSSHHFRSLWVLFAACTVKMSPFESTQYLGGIANTERLLLRLSLESDGVAWRIKTEIHIKKTSGPFNQHLI